MNVSTISLEVLRTQSSSLLTYIQVIYGIPSIFLMVFFIFLLGLAKNFDNSFYRVIQFDLIVNIFCWLNSLLAIRLIDLPYGLECHQIIETYIPGALNWIKYITFCFMHLQFFSAAALQFHRITVYRFLNRYDQVWKTKFWILPVLAVIYTSACTWLPIQHHIVEVEIRNDTLVKTTHPDRLAVSNYVILGFSITYFCIMIVMCILTSFHARKISSEGLSPSSSPITVRKLTKISTIYCILFAFLMIWGVMNFVSSNFEISEWFASVRLNLLMFCSDTVTLAMPYILIFFDTNVRRSLRRKPQTVGVRLPRNSIGT